jgi:hypothetical protein
LHFVYRATCQDGIPVQPVISRQVLVLHAIGWIATLRSFISILDCLSLSERQRARESADPRRDAEQQFAKLVESAATRRSPLPGRNFSSHL